MSHTRILICRLMRLKQLKHGQDARGRVVHWKQPLQICAKSGSIIAALRDRLKPALHFRLIFAGQIRWHRLCNGDSELCVKREATPNVRYSYTHQHGRAA